MTATDDIITAAIDASGGVWNDDTPHHYCVFVMSSSLSRNVRWGKMGRRRNTIHTAQSAANEILANAEESFASGMLRERVIANALATLTDSLASRLALACTTPGSLRECIESAWAAGDDAYDMNFGACVGGLVLWVDGKR